MPRFQSAVSGVRKRLNIPASGIPFENRADWFENFYRNPDEDTAGRYGGAYEYQLLPPNKELLDELDNLRLEFNLDSRWLHPLFNYIFSAEKSLNPPSSQSAWPSPRMSSTPNFSVSPKLKCPLFYYLEMSGCEVEVLVLSNLFGWWFLVRSISNIVR